jgi:hypothetical protein
MQKKLAKNQNRFFLTFLGLAVLAGAVVFLKTNIQL